jgi:Ca2+/Na+ antiporter
MNRSLALILLILMGIILLHSLYSFYHGRFGHAMIMFPLLLVCYVVFIGRGKWKLNSGDDQQQNNENQEDDQSRPMR